uniref:Uncharacterized protein n=1 Tax=Arundo donax TaxID=35708 RepID=A0A0A9A1Y4_ARUDO
MHLEANYIGAIVESSTNTWTSLICIRRGGSLS